MIWLVILVVLGLTELRALRTRRAGDTLSENTWDLYGVRRGSSVLSRLPLIAFLGWLLVHLSFGISTGPEASAIVGTFITYTVFLIIRRKKAAS